MNYREDILRKSLDELNKYTVPNILDFKKNIEDALILCNNDELLENAFIHWYTNNNTLEISWSFGNHTYFRLFFHGLTMAWKIRYGDTYYNNENSNGQSFFQLYEECINDMEDLYNRLTSKIETVKEFYYELKSVLDWHIASIVHNTIDKSVDYSLGINRDNFRPTISNKEDLSECDIYSLADYLDCYSISHKEKHWEIVNQQPLYDLAKRYIVTDTITETYENRLVHRKLSLEEFRESFIITFRCYLNELNRDTRLRTKYLKVIPRLTKYLGIRNNTNRPVIGIIETLDNCDIYDLGLFIKSVKQDNGQYDRLTYANFNTELVYKQLEDKYYHTYPDLPCEIIPYKTVEDTKLQAQDYVQMLYDEFRETYDSFDLKIEHHLGEKYIYVPQKAIPFLRTRVGTTFVEKDDELEENAKKLLRRGKNFKREKKYQKAIDELSKCIELNTLSTKDAVDNILSCYRKINDSENERKVALYAYSIAPLETYKSIIDRLDGMQPSISSPDRNKTIVKNLGLEFEKETRKKPEYTFNHNDDPRYELKSPQLHKCLSSKKIRSIENKFEKLYQRIGEIQYYFQSNIRQAKEHEAEGNLESAIGIYERLIAEGCYITTPYDRLIVLYSKMKRKNDYLRILELSITHFEELEKRQWDYVQYLAQKYDAHDKLNEELECNGKVGSWYPFVNLYQKYPIVQKWKERLSKISVQK